MATANEIAHERRRFSDMSQAKLRTRLSRITKVDKLLNFANMADEFGYTDLARQARQKFERITGHSVESLNTDRPSRSMDRARKKREAPKVKSKPEKKKVRVIR